LTGNAEEDDLLRRIKNLEAGLRDDPLWFDAKIAGWWVWGISCWIGGGWCTGSQKQKVKPRADPAGVNRQKPRVNHPQGIHAGCRPMAEGVGGIHRSQDWGDYFKTLQRLLREVIVCCGSWRLVTTNAVLAADRGPVGVLLDPPYKRFGTGCYDRYHSELVSTQVREWAIKKGNDDRLRIVLCGYEEEHQLPDTWSVYRWDHDKGMNKGHKNKGKERVWCSPAVKHVAGLKQLVRVG
jgi:hypothetical protein